MFGGPPGTFPDVGIMGGTTMIGVGTIKGVTLCPVGTSCTTVIGCTVM
jgi:hypothetical protein